MFEPFAETYLLRFWHYRLHTAVASVSWCGAERQRCSASMECQDIIAPADHHVVFSRQRVDVFRDDEIASTESARQHKDATDLVYQETVGALTSSDRKGPNSQYVGQDKLIVDGSLLIRRLTPLECERLQGFPDGCTDLPGTSDSDRYKALGNSVAIPCVEFIMRADRHGCWLLIVRMEGTAQLVIIHNARGLKERIDDRGADKIHPPALQVLGDAVGQLRVGAHLIIRIYNNLTVSVTPEIAVKGAEFLLNGEEDSGILNRRLDLAPVADDSRVRHQRLYLVRAILSDHSRIEIVKGPAKRHPLFQNRQPGQPSLKALQKEHLKELSVIMLRAAPFVVVIGNV